MSWKRWAPKRGSGASDDAAVRRERRSESRHECCGLKLIVRDRRALGIIHLRNLSNGGACGITDMPVAIGSLLFLELKRGHFYAARAKWARNLTIGLQFVRPMQEGLLDQLLGRAAAPD
jgi:hypothetical protein